VWDGRVAHRHIEHLALGTILGFSDSGGHCVRLPQAYTDTTIAVADDHEGAKVEPATTFDNLGNPTDLDHPVLKLGAPLVLGALAGARPAIVALLGSATSPSSATTAVHAPTAARAGRALPPAAFTS
jgi:hypothetical protein